MPASLIHCRVFRALALLAGLAMAFCGPTVARAAPSDACTKWPQNRLLIGHDLQSRRFLIEPLGDPAKAMPFFPSSAGRNVYQKSFGLYLDVSERISLFTSREPRTCLLSRDPARQDPMKTPVFFVGREGASLEDLKEDAEMVAFAPSKLLDIGASFADVTFRLKRGGSRFDEIRPFFLCGLPGLLVCQGSCPPDSVTLGASLVNDLLKPKPPQPAVTARAEAPLNPEPEKPVKAPPPVKSAPAPEKPAEPKPETPVAPAPAKPAPSLPAAPEVTPRRELPPALTVPQPVTPPPTPSLVEPRPEPAPQPAPPKAAPATPESKASPAPEPVAPPRPETVPVTPPEPEKPAPPLPEPLQPPAIETPQQQPVPPEPTPATPDVAPQPAAPAAPSAPAPQPAPEPAPPAPDNKPADTAPPAPATPGAAAVPTTRRLTLIFRQESGQPFPAEDVLRAEGSISVDGKILTPTPVGLVADLSDASFKRALDPATLEMQMPHFRISSVQTEGQRVVVTVKPLFVRAADLMIRITGAAGEPVRGCDLALDVSMNRRIGEGWPKFVPQERPRGLPFTVSDGSVYRLRLPSSIDAGELLISTAEAGAAAIILNGPNAPTCELEARPLVTAQEIRDGTISRALQRTGPTLIALLSTDASLAGSLGAVAVDAFWSNTFDLVRSVSWARYEKKVLARAQAPGTSRDTTLIEIENSATPLADGNVRDAPLRALIDGSHAKTVPGSFFDVRAIDRYHLDLALELVRKDAGITAQPGVKQETLLVVTGDVKETGSYFCQEPVSRESDPFDIPKWVRIARRTFALEVWSEEAARSMLHVSRIRPAPSAPEGVYVCRMPGAHTDKIALYGVLPSVLQDDAKRARAFTYLTEQAKAFLRP